MSNTRFHPRARAHARARIVGGRALRIAAFLAAVAAVATEPALAKPYTAPHRKVLVGVTGGRSVDGYVKAAGKRPAVFGFFVGWGDRFRYAYRRAGQAGAELMLHLSTYHGPGTQEQISPRAIAMGRGDRYLLALGRDFTAYGHPLYLRLFAEMNNAANPYSAFRRDGSARGSAHARRWFRQAWRRIYLVVKGGHVATINARLRAVGMPHVRLHSRARWLPHPKVAVQWVPMTAGSPDIAANGPGGYWPGAGYVDWVGTDFYSRFPNFRGLDRFDATSRYAGKPFVFGEWGMWGDDDPSFMRRFFAWVGRHRRVRMLVYNQGNRTAGAFRLYRYPKAAGEMRKALRAALYTGRPTGALPAIGGKTR